MRSHSKITGDQVLHDVKYMTSSIGSTGSSGGGSSGSGRHSPNRRRSHSRRNRKSGTSLGGGSSSCGGSGRARSGSHGRSSSWKKEHNNASACTCGSRDSSNGTSEAHKKQRSCSIKQQKRM